MSEVERERVEDFLDYLDSLSNFMEEARESEGLMASLAHRVFEETYRKGTAFTSDKSPFALFRYDKDTNWEDVLWHRAIDLCKSGELQKTFGLSLKDLMEMDYSTFRDVEDAVTEVITAKKQSRDQVKEDLKEEEET